MKHTVECVCCVEKEVKYEKALNTVNYLWLASTKPMSWPRSRSERGKGGVIHKACVYYSGGSRTLDGLACPWIEVVFPPQSTYWYISWETCSMCPKYLTVMVTLKKQQRKSR